VKENSTAATPRARSDIIIEHDDYIVEGIVAPQMFRARRIRYRHPAVIIAIRRIVAPALIAAHRLNAKGRSRAPQSVGPVINLQRGPKPEGCRSVPLFFQSTHTALSKRNRKM
jgi:hypothetical protein